MLIRLYLPYILILIGGLLVVTNIPKFDISSGVSGPPDWAVLLAVGMALAVTGFYLLLRRQKR